MHNDRLTSQVPLGPFEGTAITVWAAPGPKAKVHASPACSYLRSARVTRQEVRLESPVVDRMCPQCGRYGAWARPGTGLHIFLRALTGMGLLYELHSYDAADEDTCSDDEVKQAAALLYATWDSPDDGPAQAAGDGMALDDPDDEAEDTEDLDWDRRQEARHLRESVFSQWHAALISLHRAHLVLDLFPWLRPWADRQLQRKTGYLQTLRSQAAQLVRRDMLEAAAVVSVMDDPAVPSNDGAFVPLGTPAQVKRQLNLLWSRWRSKTEQGWDLPHEHTYLVHYLTEDLRGRKGRAQVLARAHQLLAQWAADLQASAGTVSGETTLVARLPEHSPRDERSSSVLDRLDLWEQAVLAAYTTASDWTLPTLTLKVPSVVAARLLSPHSSPLTYTEQKPDSSVPTAALDTPLGPGVFDDTPVHSRRPVTPAALRALRRTDNSADQLYVVFSAETGMDVVPLSTLEERCDDGWRAVIIASAGDLPDALFDVDDAPVAGNREEDEAGSVWPMPVRDPHSENFGHRLSVAEGQRVCARLASHRQDPSHVLRTLALARGVSDLRTLDEDHYGSGSSIPRSVWHGLLAMDPPSLHPFYPDTETGRLGGSGLPLGVLATVQVYTTDARGHYQGRAHSPGCTHRRSDLGVHADDDLVTLEKLLAQEHFDPCSKCGGYAIRRLNDTQTAYYRAAHRLHDLTQYGHYTPSSHPEKIGERMAVLDELDAPTAVRAWLPSTDQARRWHQHIDRLRHTLRKPHDH
ncbi:MULTISPECIES: hypothetical protein [unclassified Streptomyces]|uniref:hypothetical protein n=1 Tax=unclassified Streptomyces TaxID=2593676 RepID=UPI000BAC5DE3|nr:MULTISPECIES: hypothetical protein [unclassified Streptomyces]ASY31262.1 hypothetical protein CAC01_00020 [Streptomyces sp. CLI2509]MYX22966.1 hypothetical protein [Streptomyces sp. SID8380]